MSKTEIQIEVLVIGGGASGMMAAGRAAENGKKVILLEKNKELGKKLKITGGGRCNITNAEYDTKELLSYYGDAEKFLHSPFSKFGVSDTFDFFESKGLPLIIEDRKRAFPKTEKAFDVYAVLENYIQENNVSIFYNAAVKEVVSNEKGIISIETKTHVFHPEKVIIATGGTSHPETGSTGDGFLWLKQLGHTVMDPTPSIVPLAVQENWIKRISGIALDDIKINFYMNGEKKISKKGRILCTHFGMSGPMILNTAKEVQDLLHGGNVTAKIDLFPEFDIGTLEKKFIDTFDDHKNKSLKNVLPLLLPKGFFPACEKLFPGMDFETKVHSVSKDDRKKIVHMLKSLGVTITELMGLDRSVVSDGGVLLSEIDMKTMQSKMCPNVYVSGDLLHINRPSGGYSLQLCWTTGHIAGSSV